MTPEWERRFLFTTGGTALALLAIGYILRHLEGTSPCL